MTQRVLRHKARALFGNFSVAPAALYPLYESSISLRGETNFSADAAAVSSRTQSRVFCANGGEG
ncbi:MAG TPA: hypothetical protein VFF05_01470, partial [Rudaea sp.]|nr:hypothetical protein [Rudaea sp.]